MRMRPPLQRRKPSEQGFTLVEMSIAAALALVIMAIAMVGVVEAQRGINTAVARNTDANAAQSTLTAIGAAVGTGGTNSTVAVDSTGTQLWVYDPNRRTHRQPNKPLSSCVVWEYTNGTLSRTTVNTTPGGTYYRGLKCRAPANGTALPCSRLCKTTLVSWTST